MTTQSDMLMTPAAERVLCSCRDKLPEFSANKVLDVIGRHIGRYKSSEPEDRNPAEFAISLLFIYKIGSCICAYQQGYIPASIWHCFSGYDAERICKHHPSLGRRLFLCTQTNLDIMDWEWELAGEVFYQLTGRNLEFLPKREEESQPKCLWPRLQQSRSCIDREELPAQDVVSELKYLVVSTVQRVRLAQSISEQRTQMQNFSSKARPKIAKIISMQQRNMVSRGNVAAVGVATSSLEYLVVCTTLEKAARMHDFRCNARSYIIRIIERSQMPSEESGKQTTGRAAWFGNLPCRLPDPFLPSSKKIDDAGREDA